MYGEQQLDSVFFTADSHFGHANILEYTHRPFSDIEEMNAGLIERWNKRVGPDDVVYDLGDFTLGMGRDAGKYFSKLNGMIHVIPGGHDYRWTTGLEDRLHSASGWEVSILPPLFDISIRTSYLERPLTIVLCHYAMRVWNKSHYGSLHLYGHSHGTLPGLGRSMDVGVDAHNFYPISLREVMDALQRIPKPNL